MKYVDVWNFVEDVARFRDFEKSDTCDALQILMELREFTGAMLFLNVVAIIIAAVTAGVAWFQ